MFIASPNHLHGAYTQMAANAGKHVLVEKPMALTVQEGMEMVETCKDRGVKLGLGFQPRVHPGHVEARRFVKEGALGTMVPAPSCDCAGTTGQLKRPPRTGLSESWDHPDMMGTGVHCMTTHTSCWVGR